MVGTPARLPAALDQDDSQLRRVLAGERTHGVGELVVRNEDPAPPGGIALARVQLAAELLHAEAPDQALETIHSTSRPRSDHADVRIQFVATRRR